MPRWLAPRCWAFRLNHRWAMCRAAGPLQRLVNFGTDAVTMSMFAALAT